MTEIEMPTAGGSFSRDPVTGKLLPLGDEPAEAPAALVAPVAPPSPPTKTTEK